MKNIVYIVSCILLLLVSQNVSASQDCIFDTSNIEYTGTPTLGEIKALKKNNTDCKLIKVREWVEVWSVIDTFPVTYYDSSSLKGLELTKRGDSWNTQLILESLSPKENEISYGAVSWNMTEYGVDDDIFLELALTDDVEKVEVTWDWDMDPYTLKNFVAGSGKAKYSIEKSLGNIKSWDNRYLIRAYWKNIVYEDVVLINRKYSSFNKAQIKALENKVQEFVTSKADMTSKEWYVYLRTLLARIDKISSRYSWTKKDIVRLIRNEIQKIIDSYDQDDVSVFIINKNMLWKYDIVKMNKKDFSKIEILEKDMTKLACVFEEKVEWKKNSEDYLYWSKRITELTGKNFWNDEYSNDSIYFCKTSTGYTVTYPHVQIKDSILSKFQSIVTLDQNKEKTGLIHGDLWNFYDTSAVRLEYKTQDKKYVTRHSFGDAGCFSRGYQKILWDGTKKDIYIYGWCFNYETNSFEYNK